MDALRYAVVDFADSSKPMVARAGGLQGRRIASLEQMCRRHIAMDENEPPPHVPPDGYGW
jgi:hypothetical protein